MITRTVLFEDAFGLGAGVSLVGTGSSTGAGTTVAVPGGTAAGDIAVMGVMTVNSIPNAAGPSGGAAWNEAYRKETSGGEWHAVYWKVCGGSEGANWTLTQSSSEMSIGAAVFRSTSDALYGFTGADNQLLPGWIPAHPYGFQVLMYMSITNNISSAVGESLLTAILVQPGSGGNAQVLIEYRDTTWVGDAEPIRCGGLESGFSGAMNMTFYPS